MKSRICPYRNFCHDAGACETCDYGRAFEKMNKKIKRLETENKALRSENKALISKTNGLRTNVAIIDEIHIDKSQKKYPERYTRYDFDLKRFVVPCLYKEDGTQITFCTKEEPAEIIDYQNLRGETIRVCRSPALTIVWGEAIDRLAEYENEKEKEGE